MSNKLRLGILASGGGTNLQAIIDRIQDGTLHAEIALILSNKPTAGALQRGRLAGIPTLCIDQQQYKNRLDFDRAMVAALNEARVELVVLAGFMRLISNEFLEAFPDRIMNIHPALLPAFSGLNAQQQALDHGTRITGCTVHFVDAGVDTGPIVVQAAVPVLQNDTLETLSARILRQEHRIYPEAIRLFAEGRLRLEGRRVLIDPPLENPDQTLLSPPLS
ncbi:phosphoribosylglycinamide formyltransferase [Syntrophotalea acetylenivorans]|uniref:Phosphoribosylglycinamide formyltransferase n=1 Tax=Syntrophotalea acetylenivorans TaxID=1842532 RepID=A0A1L3GL69_9BACT|nr:phosphoribosylglycinamide formyltransferase [Syntrophotalea acetylenivorans]APG26679.1 phosphoribosylglycinamide formyltransferase [Syntrophotalea acetylenivorans]